MSEPRTYEVRLTEPAEMEMETEHTRLSVIVSLEYADRWQDALLAEIMRLSTFPRLYEIAPENDLYDVPVRRLLYFGPSKSRGMAYRILFHIIEPTAAKRKGSYVSCTSGMGRSNRVFNTRPSRARTFLSQASPSSELRSSCQ